MTTSRKERVRGVVAAWVFALVAWGASPPTAAAQDPAPLVVSDVVMEVRLGDGSVLYGRVAEASESRVVLVTEAGVRVELSRAQIASARPLRGELRDGVVWEADANATRLFFGPTGRTLAAGGGYLGAFELFFPFVAYAPTDRILLAAGTPIGPEIMGEAVYVAPKVRVLSRPGLDVAVGGVSLFATGDVDLDAFGVVYGTATLGEPDRAVTAGAGWGFSDGEFDNKPVFLLGGERRVSRRFKLLSENYLFLFDDETFDPSTGATTSRTDAAGIISGGIRVIGERLSADLGLAAYVGDGSGCCLPLVNFVYSF